MQVAPGGTGCRRKTWQPVNTRDHFFPGCKCRVKSRSTPWMYDQTRCQEQTLGASVCICVVSSSVLVLQSILDGDQVTPLHEILKMVLRQPYSNERGKDVSQTHTIAEKSSRISERLHGCGVCGFWKRSVLTFRGQPCDMIHFKLFLQGSLLSLMICHTEFRTHRDEP